MRIDSETGEIKSVSYETHEAVKEEYESKIKKLENRIEDLEDIIAEQEEDIQFFIKNAIAQNEFINHLLKGKLKKDSITAMTESK